MKNNELFEILLIAFQSGHMKDSAVMPVLQDLVEDLPWINTMGCSDELFMVWLSKRLHLQLSHIHDCKKYPNRVVRRVSDLDAESLPSYQKLMDLVQANPCKSIAGSPAAKQDVASPRTSCSETAGSSMDSKAVQHPKIKSFDIPTCSKPLALCVQVPCQVRPHQVYHICLQPFLMPEIHQH